MDRYRDIVAKGKVVKHIDTEEDHDVWQPSDKGYSGGFEEERWTRGGEVSGPGEQHGHNELSEGDEKSFAVVQSYDREDSRRGSCTALGFFSRKPLLVEPSNT